MVLCLKCAEALGHMIFGDKREKYDWFPESFEISEKRLKKTMFEGKAGLKAPPEIAGADFKSAINGTH